MAGIPDTIIDQVRDRTDIVEIIARYLPLKRAGRNYKANCPFHHEKTASFMVSPAKQIFHCFGCGAGGNVFNFLMKYERLEFPEAVGALAERAGIEIPKTHRTSPETTSLAQKLHQVNELATGYYYNNLARHEHGHLPRQYLQSRGIKSHAVDRFKLGYSLKAWDGFINFARSKGVSEALLEKTGLILKKENRSFYDRFRDRIMFPIFDIKGKVKGFGGRVLNDQSGPKYMNSPETHIYTKGRELYGLNIAWEDIRRQDCAVIVEGYLDLLTPFQHEIKNMVASLGTALTIDQIKLLKRFTSNLVMLFDSDQAGQTATLRSLDLIIQEDMNVKVVQMPSGFDPDSYIHKYGSQRLSDMIKNAQDLFDYKLKLLSSRFNPKKIDGKARIAEEMLPTISKMKNAILRSGYLRRLAESLDIDEESLRTELKKVKPDYSHRYQIDRDRKAPAPKTASRTAERILTGLMIENNSLVELVRQNLTMDDFKDEAIKKIVASLYKIRQDSESISPSKLVSLFEKDELSSVVSELLSGNDDLVDKDRNFEDCIKWIKQDNLKGRLDLLREKIKTAQDSENHDMVVELVTQYNRLLSNSNT